MIAGGTDRARREEMPGSKVRDVGPSGSGAGASQHRAVGGPQHVVRRPERAGLPGWREGARRTLPLDPPLLPSAPRRAHRPERAPAGLGCRRAAAAVGGKELLAEAGRRCDVCKLAICNYYRST